MFSRRAEIQVWCLHRLMQSRIRHWVAPVETAQLILLGSEAAASGLDAAGRPASRLLPLPGMRPLTPVSPGQLMNTSLLLAHLTDRAAGNICGLSAREPGKARL